MILSAYRHFAGANLGKTASRTAPRPTLASCRVSARPFLEVVSARKRSYRKRAKEKEKDRDFTQSTASGWSTNSGSASTSLKADATSYTWKINVAANQTGVEWRLGGTNVTNNTNSGTISGSQSGSTISVTVSFAKNTGSGSRTITATLSYGHSGSITRTLTQVSAYIPHITKNSDGTYQCGNLKIAATNVDTKGKFCANPTDHGGLFSWSTSDDGPANGTAHSACPSGWRLPTEEDWCMITNGDKDDWQENSYTKGWSYKGTEGVDAYAQHSSGLILPAAGYYAYYFGHTIIGVGTNGAYWTDEQRQYDRGYSLRFTSSALDPSDNNYKLDRLPVRCVR